MSAYYSTVIIAAGAVIGWLAADNRHLRKKVDRLKDAINGRPEGER